MKIIVTGATGMVGSEVIRQAIADNDIESVAAIVRKPLDINHPKLLTIIHQNFSDYSGLEEVFKANDACVWCLGISQTLVSKDEYMVITYDYTIATAKAMVAANPDIAFLFLSGMGADITEKSRTLFARVKGKTENALHRLAFKKLYIVRPGGIKPIHKKSNAAFSEKLLLQLINIMELIVPFTVITSVQLAKAMLYIIKNDSDKVVFGNRDLRKLSAGIK